jgi:hypothetical protein
LDHERAPFPQIALSDLHVAIFGQLTPTQLAFDRQLKPGPLEMEGFNATLRGR